ncbi:MAG: imidazoleglycerol-phosphate dehydratase HisB [Christensenellales bacterium]|jgi:imidazoleglycerol-phosphate dehydratase
MRIAEIARKTTETDVYVRLAIDGRGAGEIDTGVGFFDHMLMLLSRHAAFDLTVRCAGDRHVDDHHTVEDVGICLGRALKQALGEKVGIVRYADVTLPMDEALILCAVDLSGRGGLHMDVQFPTEKIGAFDTQLVKEFMEALARSAEMTLHLRMLAGENSHHIAEGQFKALARALHQAVRIDPARADMLPSTKGVLA